MIGAMVVAGGGHRSISDLVSLEGRVAVVTGGARGTGAAIVARLAEAGATVVDTDVEATESEVSAFADQVVHEHGAIDVWVNNAGIYPSTPVLDMTEAQWDEVTDFNLKGAFLGAREAARRMVAGQHGGVIVNIASTSAFRASAPGLAHYVASKFGVPRVDTGAGRRPRSARRAGARGGGDVHRDAGDSERVGATSMMRSTRRTSPRVGAGKPLGRVAVPDDVARVVLFCASDLSSLMTGSTVVVDAGDLAR